MTEGISLALMLLKTEERLERLKRCVRALKSVDALATDEWSNSWPEVASSIDALEATDLE